MLGDAFKAIDKSLKIEERSWSGRCANQHDCRLTCEKEYAAAHPGQIEYDWRCTLAQSLNNVSAVFYMVGGNDAKV